MQRSMQTRLQRIERGIIDPSFEITYRAPLKQASEACKMSCEEKVRCIKVVMKA